MFAPMVLPFFLGTMSYWRTHSIETAKEKVIQVGNTVVCRYALQYYIGRPCNVIHVGNAVLYR